MTGNHIRRDMHSLNAELRDQVSDFQKVSKRPNLNNSPKKFLSELKGYQAYLDKLFSMNEKYKLSERLHELDQDVIGSKHFNPTDILVALIYAYVQTSLEEEGHKETAKILTSAIIPALRPQVSGNPFNLAIIFFADALSLNKVLRNKSKFTSAMSLAYNNKIESSFLYSFIGMCGGLQSAAGIFSTYKVLKVSFLEQREEKDLIPNTPQKT